MNLNHKELTMNKMPETLLTRLYLIVETAEAIINDQPEALHIRHILDIRNLAMGALSANEYEEAEMKAAGTWAPTELFMDRTI